MTPQRLDAPEPGLYALLNRARFLLLDFDGPVCRLFGGSPAADIARRMRDFLAGRGLLPAGQRHDRNPALAAGTDPHWLLARPWDRGTHAVLEGLLALGEQEAAASAVPTPGADVFVRAVADSGRMLAITTNNALAAVETYLKNHDLEGCFNGRVFGRDPDDPARMKPDPDCLLRAMTAMEAAPEDCLAIGDSPRDAVAALAAGVPFLGYARSEDRVARLRDVGPYPVVVGTADLVVAAGKLDWAGGP
ncbi:HAD family hydrolase [Streptomyces sp. NPDC008139]|uniref:HAD family hydrolase n=1 Tax=Streptomyces sp. NPDC008139 TaxID=3364814 RepID=UPI0036E5EFC5